MKGIISKIIGLVLFFVIIIGSVIFAGIYIDETLNSPSKDAFLGGFEGTLPPSGDSEIKIKVLLEHDENCVVVSQNPVFVDDGEDAIFEVVFKENYAFSQIENGKYYDGYVTVRTPSADTTAKISSKLTTAYYSFDYVIPSLDSGTVECNKQPGQVSANQSIIISATPKENATFLGWSAGETVVNGGKMLSYSRTYAFKPTEDVVLYPNFLEEGYAIIKYNLNGGVLAGDNVTDTIITQFNTSVKPCPNLLANDGTFYREGYTLIEYNTSPDGRGEAINPGGLTSIPKTGLLEIYCQWSKWTSEEDFSYSISNNQVTITAYNGDDDTVSIPESISGVPVTKISRAAFVNKSFYSLVLPPSIRTIDSAAFIDCKYFNTLYIYDTFTSIPDDAFSDCKAFSNLRLNAGRGPVFVNNAESIASRFEVLLSRRDNKPLILLVGGSSCLYGFDSPFIEEMLDYKYHVVNCGTNAGGTGMLYIEALSSFMREGDIIISVPEYDNVQMGDYKLFWRTYRATESCYNIFRYVDFSKYTHFFSSFSEFNTSTEARALLKPSTYYQRNSTLTEGNCDIKMSRSYVNQIWSSDISVHRYTVSDERIARINQIIEIVEGKNITYLFSCAPIYKHTYGGTKETVDGYTQSMKERLDCPFISDPNDYFFEYNEYYDSIYHLTSEAAKKRSRQLALDILAYFENQ